MKNIAIFLCFFLILLSCSPPKKQPNIIVIFCDDLGYGDIGCFGSTKHQTPNIDSIAKNGLRLTDFYVSSGVCTPSRSSLMTGCYPRRVNLHMDAKNRCVLFPVAHKGLHPDENTIADVLRDAGYATACIGKWHLGDQPEFLPTKQGFDYYYGIPYSNDMGTNQGPGRPPLPLLENETVIEAPVDQTTITKRYTQKAIQFIWEHKNKPFFLYFPHTMPHNPVNASDLFRGKSANGLYGDAVEEIDFSTGQILHTLDELGLTENTIVLFTSDNGAASRWGGSNGNLRGWKGSTWEGGQRVPCVVQWPGKIPQNDSSKVFAATIDLLPTFAKLAGITNTDWSKIDGLDISEVLFGTEREQSPHQAFYYYQMDQLQAVRSGKWKLHLKLDDKKRNWGKPEGPQEYMLFDLHLDRNETTNVAGKYPEIVRQLVELAEKARLDLGDENINTDYQRQAGFVDNPVPLTK